MRSCNVGIIGFGFIGKVHAYCHVNMPFFYDPAPCTTRITHICTSRIETAEKGRALVGAKKATTDYREITENPDIDIVHICTPNYLHKDALLSAMAHGKHIYCDKPLTATAQEAQTVREALDSYTGIAQMTFNNRFVPATLRAKQLADDGFLGKLLGFRAAFMHSGNANPNAPLKWKLSKKAGGGVLPDLGSHVLDLLSYLGVGLAEVLAAEQIAYPDRPLPEDPAKRVKVDAEDSVFVLARTGEGALGSIEATKVATGAEDELRFEVHGAQGALRFNSRNPLVLEAFDASLSDQPIGGRSGWTAIHTGQRYPKPAAPFPGSKLAPGWMRSHVACLAHFLECVADGRPADPGIEQGIYLRELMDRVERSAAQGAWVRV
jgi:predicted dehydrogenase